MSDVLEQWRSAKERWIISGEANEMIVGLENEIERLREALNEIACWEDGEFGPHMCEPSSARKARAALGEGKE